jgi:FkbM family methyltransferase
MIARDPAPRYELIPDPHEAKRVRTTVSCTDVDGLPKVDGAGSILVQDGVSVQLMHNGLVIEEGCYGGQWMTEVIRALHGHHEPQEELVFDAMLRRLADDGRGQPTMIEFGSFWTYYGMWFAKALPGARVIAVEPDPHNMEVGELNARLNSLTDSITFVRGAIGAEPGSTFEFTAESDGQPYEVAQHDLASVMDATNLDHVDLVLADVQGAETVLLHRAMEDFAAKRVRFLVVSTHHRSISGDALTHQRALRLLVDAGAHIIAEHSIPESFSGDGLIAASFDERDRDMHVGVSFARSKDSIFDEVEYDLDATLARLESATAAQRERDEIVASKVWRWSTPLRRLNALVRRA